jgi:NADH-quinone oxidoreductase subunit M
MSQLTILLLIPLTGAVIVMLLPSSRLQLVRVCSIAVVTLELLYSWSLIESFEFATSAFQFSESVPWNLRMGTSYSLGVDGFSFPMVLLATLLCWVSVLASKNITHRCNSYYALILVLETAMLGVFLAQDWALFYVFWEMTLIPLFFLIDRWGGKHRDVASLNFVLYTMGGSVFLLVSLLVLFDSLPAHSFSMAQMTLAARELQTDKQVLLFLGFLIGFGVKMPIFPIHGWLPLAHVEAPAPVSILLSGILLKMGSYGLIRAGLMLPDAVIALQWLLLTLALISLIYGGLLAWRQSDLKKMIAYSSVSHMGVVLLGIAVLNEAGIAGAMYQMVAHGLVAAALFLLIGQLYERTHTLNINDYSSLIKVTPRFTLLTTIALIGAIGLPGTAGFIAELHVLIGGFERWSWLMLIMSLGLLISAAYGIRTIGRLFTGPARPRMSALIDLQGTEMVAAVVLVGGIIYLGLFPTQLLSMMSGSVMQMSALFTGI